MFRLNNDSTVDFMKFYVAANDRDLLGKLTAILERKGLVSFWEKSGEMSFIVDGRKGIYYAIKQIDEISDTMENNLRNENLDNAELLKFIYQRLLQLGFRRELKGTEFLRDVIFYLFKNTFPANNLSKGVYLHLAKYYLTDVKLIDRTIRYARVQAGIRLSNLSLIHKLLPEIRQEFNTQAKPCKVAKYAEGQNEASIKADELSYNSARIKYPSQAYLNLPQGQFMVAEQ